MCSDRELQHFFCRLWVVIDLVAVEFLLLIILGVIFVLVILSMVVLEDVKVGV